MDQEHARCLNPESWYANPHALTQDSIHDEHMRAQRAPKCEARHGGERGETNAAHKVGMAEDCLRTDGWEAASDGCARVTDHD